MPICNLTANDIAILEDIALSLLWVGKDRAADAIWFAIEADGLAEPTKDDSD